MQERTAGAEKISPARQAALAVLEIVRSDSAPLPVLLDKHCQDMDSRDAALTTELVHGVLRLQARLDHVLSPCLHKPGGLPARQRIILRLACYELFCLDIPAWATVHQYVSLTRYHGGVRAAGLVNAVLRSLLRKTPGLANKECDVDIISLPGGLVPQQQVMWLGSVPLWLACRWIKHYGNHMARDLARHSAARPLPAFRLNARAKGSARTILEQNGALPCARHGLILPDISGREILLRDLEAQGLLSRQGVGSQMLVDVLVSHIRRLPEGSTVWDACCGRGGKTCALLEQGVKVTLASDPSASRLADLEQSLSRLGLPAPRLLNAGLAEAVGEAGRFACVLVDAPCSGTGTLARVPELRLRLDAHRLCEAQKFQAELLDAAWPAVMSGGLLAYATCAVNRPENEDQTAAFLIRHPDARLESEQLLIPSFAGHDILYLALIRRI